MKINQTGIPDCFEIIPNRFVDERGHFVKTFHSEVYLESGLETNFVEQYYSHSKKGVLRGLHFQTPPKEHNKLVYCISGNVMDVVVDLREGSPTYGKYEIFELNDVTHSIIYIPSGLAHGFIVLSESATLMYNVSSVYSAQCDTGIHWDSLLIPWPIKYPIISKRDSDFVRFSDFKSPFVYREG
ncbi:dTDP-4-dehydrorhamnose 3,5-epimerase [Paenibacillus sp. V4I7]|uniref:dTDP-4-dehydrorhamnose 3,5-epimerase n=1 Tax=Paenibacillus sp. V4I7 TaxID=3042307 RepID=UPI002781C2CF|nr:dTDP-4-dehydrorhamnose 3,5-epimerase [Paenibacillus sp. V4I7]MDQ0903911.1 dTDP-4-dehydrorhamnose 3,5-epimerase [Paenibacillus sp. V4I7]